MQHKKPWVPPPRSIFTTSALFPDITSAEYSSRQTAHPRNRIWLIHTTSMLHLFGDPVYSA